MDVNSQEVNFVNFFSSLFFSNARNTGNADTEKIDQKSRKLEKANAKAKAEKEAAKAQAKAEKDAAKANAKAKKAAQHLAS